MCVRPPDTSQSTEWRGFSLIELLIVLGILALLAGLALPALRGPLDRGRLRGAGRQVENALAKARSLAIRSGKEHWLRYEINGRDWRIETRRGPGAVDSIDPATDVLTPDPADLTGGDALVREGRLPKGIRFAAAETTVQLVGSERVLTEPDDAIDLLTPAGQSWSKPIRFRPNGRAASATITLLGLRDFQTVVRLRGLTGAVTVQIERRRKDDADPEVSLQPTTRRPADATAEPLP